MQGYHQRLYCTKDWYHLYISDPFWLSTKNADCQGKMFLSTEKVLEKISEDQP